MRMFGKRKAVIILKGFNMETKHTPGPWFVEEFNGEFSLSFNVSAANESIAGLWYWTEDSNDKSYANARLIAAAPDLLEAGKALLAALNINGYAIPESQGDALAAAIAKATGQ